MRKSESNNFCEIIIIWDEIDTQMQTLIDKSNEKLHQKLFIEKSTPAYVVPIISVINKDKSIR